MSEAPRPPVADALERAIRAHPVLRDQKKLKIVPAGSGVRLEGQVFTLDMLRQVTELVARLPDADEVRLAVEAEIQPPKARDITGRVPRVSPGPSNVDREFSTGHLKRARKFI
jgi:hypothetical protein